MKTTPPPDPIWDIVWKYLILAIASFLLLFGNWACTAHAGQLSKFDTSIRHTRRMTRITVLRPTRSAGRAAAGYPFLQTTANVTRLGVNLSGLINPIGWFF